VLNTNAARSEPARCAYLGRDAELEQLHAAYELVARKGGRLVLVEGPSGVGKTPLLHAFRTKIRLEGGVVLEGRCEPGQAFRPFAEIVERALHFLAEVGRAPSHSMADLGCSQGCHPFWYQHANLALGGPTRSDDRSVLEQRVRLFDAIAELLCDVAKLRVPVVLLHGIERADRGTTELLRHLLEDAGPWNESPAVGALFVASVRTGVEPIHGDAIEALRNGEDTLRISLGRLDHQGVSAYLQNPETVARIIERTGGHPETIELLLTADPLTPEARVARLLAELDPRARELAEALAVLDCPAEAELLAAVAALDPCDPRSFAAFAGSELVERTVVDGHISFAFARERDREHAYALVPEPRRIALHRNAMTEFAKRPISDHYAAHHALAAHEIGNAMTYARAAAVALAASHGHAEAAVLLERVADAAGERCTPELRENLADLHRLSGDYQRALVHARALAEEQPNDPRAAKLLGELLRLAGQLDDALGCLEEARQLAARADDRREVAEVDAQLAELHYRRSSYDPAERHAALAIEEARAQGEIVIELDARNTAARVALARHEERAMSLFEHVRRLAIEAELPRQHAQAANGLGIAHLQARELVLAAAAFEDAVSAARTAGDLRTYAIAVENLAVLAHLKRDYATAPRHYHEAVGVMKRLGNRSLLARAAMNLGELYLSLGEQARARSLADFATRVGGPAIPPINEAEIAMLRGRIECAEGDTRAARTTFNAARSVYAQLGDPREATAVIELAWTSILERDGPGARASLAEVRVGDSPKQACAVALATAAASALLGEPAIEPAERAVALAEAAQDPELLLRSLLRLARALLDRGEVVHATKLCARAERVEAELTAHVPTESMAGWTARTERLELLELAGRVGSPSDRSLSRSSNGTARSRQRARWARAYSELVGDSPSMDHVRATLDKVAPTDALVLIRGESGTGKELIADAIQRNSSRRSEPFVKINCAALVESLLLSELFGHERGAFTGASARKKGRFEVADRGTLFLDEIGDVSPATQVALLRVLQERTFERVGGTESVRVDVRIIAATHRDLEAMVRNGSFREDLYYRLRGVTIELPPLRNRMIDLGDIAKHLLSRIAVERAEPERTVSDAALTLLLQHRWPGNVRELENVLRGASLFAESNVLTPDDFEAFRETFVTDASETPPRTPEEQLYERIRVGTTSLSQVKKTLERECIVRALKEADWNITHAAALLGMKRPRLSQLVKEHALTLEAQS
jgi:DNA-binding NtrC family response regulator/tetratricopeptide (TPR) repeat protein